MLKQPRLEGVTLAAWLLFLLLSASAITRAAGQAEVHPPMQQAVAGSPATPRQLWPIRNITCCYDVDTGFITGIRYSRFSSQGEALTSKTGRCSRDSALTSSITLPSTADIYITAVNATYTDMSLLSIKFLLSNDRQRTCVVNRAAYNPNIRSKRIRQRQQAAAGLTTAATAAADVDQNIRRAASSIGLAQTTGAYSGPIKGYTADKPSALSVRHRVYEGPVIFGRRTGLSSLQGICDPRNRYLKNFERVPYNNPYDHDDDDDDYLGPGYNNGNSCFHWVPCPGNCTYWPNCTPCSKGSTDPKCCCYTSYPVKNPFTDPPSSPRPDPGPTPWPHDPWPDPIDQALSPSPPGPTPPPMPSPSPRPPAPSPPPGTSPSPRPPRPSPSPRPGPSPSPRPPRSPAPGRSPRPTRSPHPVLPAPFTIGFAARGQHGCIDPVTDLFTARVYQYAYQKLAAAGFSADYALKLNNCTCVVDAAQWNTPKYNCNLELSIADPQIDSPEIIANYIAIDVSASGPWACIDEQQLWCAQAPEYPTSACATYPANNSYTCTIDEPPDPLPIPVVFVDEGRNCNGSVQYTPDQQQALVDNALKLTAGLGLVLTYENFTCGNALGSAFYQATLLLAAGVNVDIYTGSDNIVAGINAQPTACQKVPKPAYCPASPLANTPVCTVNQYDPNQPYICPTAAGNLALTMAVPSCNCTANPDSVTNHNNLRVWMSTIVSNNAISAAVTVPEGTCVQSGIDCQYQYRVRAQPLDEFTDAFGTIQTIATDIKNNPQPCWPADSSGGWPFCSDWAQATACARVPWNRDQPLTCTILPTN